jgi:hypothetical protein
MSIYLLCFVFPRKKNLSTLLLIFTLDHVSLLISIATSIPRPARLLFEKGGPKLAHAGP